MIASSDNGGGSVVSHLGVIELSIRDWVIQSRLLLALGSAVVAGTMVVLVWGL